MSQTTQRLNQVLDITHVISSNIDSRNFLHEFLNFEQKHLLWQNKRNALWNNEPVLAAKLITKVQDKTPKR